MPTAPTSANVRGAWPPSASWCRSQSAKYDARIDVFSAGGRGPDLAGMMLGPGQLGRSGVLVDVGPVWHTLM